MKVDRSNGAKGDRCNVMIVKDWWSKKTLYLKLEGVGYIAKHQQSLGLRVYSIPTHDKTMMTWQWCK